MRKIVLGFFGDGPWSHGSLSRLLADDTLRVAFICARFDTPDEELRRIASHYRIDFYCNNNVNSDEFLAIAKSYRCDLFVSMSFNQIFKKEMLAAAPEGIINCHAGKLPFYRGRNVLNWAIINGESEFGITAHFVDEGIDTGDIIEQVSIPIEELDNYATVLQKAYSKCPLVLYSAIKKVQEGNLLLIKQSDINSFGSYCIQRKKGDERLNWNQSSRDVYNFVRAISQPGPEATTYLGQQEVKIGVTQYFPKATTYIGIPGSVIFRDELSFCVKTLDSFVQVLKWSGCSIPKIGERFQ